MKIYMFKLSVNDEKSCLAFNVWVKLHGYPLNLKPEFLFEVF